MASLKKLLKLWQKNNLITQGQADNILEFMKERQKIMFFSMLKWLMIIGTFWLVGGIIGTVINVFELDIFHKIWEKICSMFAYISMFISKYIMIPFHNFIIHPICVFVERLFGNNRYYFYWGTLALILTGLIQVCNFKIKQNNNIDNLSLSEEQKNVLKTNWVMETLFCIFLSAVFCLYNMLLIPSGNFISDYKIIPMWNIIGAITFVFFAYKLQKNIYLVFGIYFIALSIGMFCGYDFACYWIGVSRPIIQIIVGVILILIAYISQLKIKLEESKDENESTYLIEKFAGTYNWAGLLFVFTALWIASFWGFGAETSHYNISSAEIWYANILFILTSVSAMYYGAKTEQKIFFNYGITFFIIESYTLLIGRLWKYLPGGIASLLLGLLLIGTAKFLQKNYLKNLLKK